MSAPPDAAQGSGIAGWQLAAVAVVTAALTWWVWSAWAPTPIVADEVAYLLQAGIFADGRVTAPARPLPMFFEQIHIFSSPAVFAKYFPGHPLLLAAGVIAGAPAAIPVLASVLTALLIVRLANRLAGPAVAWLSWLWWLAAPGALNWRASFLSQTTAGAAGLLAGWWVLRWVDEGRRRHLIGALAALGALALIRPLVAVSFGAPLVAVVVWRLWRQQLWRQCVWAVTAAAVIVAGIPLWNHLTLGRWLRSPYVEYSRRYLPAESFGFGLTADAPREPLPEDLQAIIRDWAAVHREHTPGALPGILLARADAVARDVWGAWGGRWLGLLVLPGGVGLGATAGVAAAVVLGQFGIFACYAHPWFWTLYYAELFPILCFFSVRGLDLTLKLGVRRGWYRPAWAAGALVAIGVAVALAQGPAVLAVRQAKQAGMQPWRHFQEQLAGVPEPRVVVFVRRSPVVSHHISLVRNGPCLDRERIWVAYDRGAENRLLLDTAPDRAPYVYLEDTGMLLRVNR